MRKWLANLKSRLATKPKLFPDIQPPTRPQWTEADRDQLNGFLRSQTGHKLLTMLRGAEYANALLGAKSGNDRITLGIGEAIKLMGSLAGSCDPAKDAKPQTQKSELELLVESWAP